MESTIIGVVLCGGQSKMMGTDKGMIRQNDLTWSEIAYSKLNQIIDEVYVSINDTQFPKYCRIFPEEKLIRDSVNIPGPLGGLMSIHNQFPGKDIFLFACDMVSMDITTLSTLLDVYKFYSGKHDFYSYKNAGQFEPMAGIYTAKVLSKFFIGYITGERREYSLKYLMKNGNAFSLEVKDTCRFINYNSRSEFALL